MGGARAVVRPATTPARVNHRQRAPYALARADVALPAADTRATASRARPGGGFRAAARDAHCPLGEPPQRVDVGLGGVVAVHPGTPLQLRNETAEEILLFAYGAPPVTGNPDFLDDIGGN
jgi:hypothetical protein